MPCRAWVALGTPMSFPWNASSVICGWLFSGDLYLGDRIEFFRTDEKIDQQIQSLQIVLQHGSIRHPCYLIPRAALTCSHAS